jgi:thiamine kinase-like enzyme
MTVRLDAALLFVPGYDPAHSKVTPLSGGITNENFRVEVGSATYVLRLAGPRTEELGIDREHELACARIAAQLDVGPEVVSVLPQGQGLVSRFVPSHPVTEEAARQPDTLARFARSLRTVHEGPAFPGHFSPFDTVRTYYAHAREKRVTFPAGIDRVLARADELERAVRGKRADRPCHNDLLAGNLLDDGQRIWILDWEYAAMGDPMFDLGNFAVNQGLDEAATRVLLRAYFGQDRDEDLVDLQRMRAASDLREAFWGFLQSGLSALDFDYRGYAMKHLERFNG